jgi:hypothetical protein
MAASKLHLKNVNKDYKLEATDKRTNEGRIVYKNTKTGELHSELSMTLEMPEGSGNWINVPSLINGRVYNVQGVLDMLKAGNIEPNSTGHKSETAAVEAAIFRSNNLLDDVGISLKPNNEVDLKNNDPKIVRAFQPAYTTGPAANDAILAAAEAALAEDIATKQTIVGQDSSTTENSVFTPHIKAGTDGGDTKWTGWGGGIAALSDKGMEMIIKNKRERREAAAKKAEIERGTATLNQLDVEKDDSYFQRPIAGNINDPFTTTQYLNPRGLADREANMARGVEDRAVTAEEAAIAEARKREEIIGQTMSAYGPRTGQSPIPEGAVLTYADGRAYNGAVQMINGQLADAAGQELVVNDVSTIPVDDTNQAMLAKAVEEKILKDSTKDDNRTFGQKFKDAMSKVAGVAEMSYTGDQARADKLINDAENAFQNQDTIDPIVEYNQGQAELLAQSKALSEKNRKSFAPLYQMPDRTYGDVNANSTVSDYANFTGTGTQTDEIKLNPLYQIPDRTYGNATNNVVSDYAGFEGIKSKSKKTTIPKDVKPNYGKMPGFKLPPKDAKGKSTGNYWSVDETSPFWQTDAGYEKAMQTWGEKPGWVKPGFRPKKEELDINAIKKWFTPSK